MPALPLLLAQVAADVGSGRITGGWSYVYAAYGITWAAIALYGLSLVLRARAQKSTPKELP